MPATWRDHPQFVKGYFYVHAPSAVFQARVRALTLRTQSNNALGKESRWYYIHYETITLGSAADIVADRTITLGSATLGRDHGVSRVLTSGAAYDSGLVVTGDACIAVYVSTGNGEGTLNPQVGDYITIWYEHRIGSRVPFYDNGGFAYMDGIDVGGYADTLHPVANAGPWVAKWVDTDTGVITVEFDGTASFAHLYVGTITNYLWDVDDGTITVGASSSDAITATFPPGFRYVSLTVTDNNTETHTTYVPVAALAQAVASAELSYAGATITASTQGGGAASRAFDGSLTLVWQTSLSTPTGWVKAQLATAKRVTRYGVQHSSVHDVTAAPQDWTLEASNTGAFAGEEVVLDTQTAQTGWSASEERAFDITSPGIYLYYRLDVTANNGFDSLIVAELNLYTSIDAHLPIAAALSPIRKTSEGQRLSARILQDLDPATYPSGSLVMYFEDEYYNGVVGSLAGPTDREHMRFCGWMDREQKRREADTEDALDELVLDCVDVGGRLAQLQALNWILNVDASPDDWTDMGLPTLDKFIWFVLAHFTTALEVAPFTMSAQSSVLNFYRGLFYIMASDAQTIYEQCDALARKLDHRFTCDQWGQLSTVMDPQLFPSSKGVTELTSYAYTNRDVAVALQGPNGAGGTTTVDTAGTTDTVLGNSGGTIYSQAQSFTVTTGRLSSIDIRHGANTGSPTGGCAWYICRDNGSGAPDYNTAGILDGGTYAVTASAVNTITVTNGYRLAAGVTYWLVVVKATQQAAGNYYTWKTNTANPYANGNRSQFDSSTWSAQAGDDMRCAITTAAETAKSQLAQSFVFDQDIPTDGVANHDVDEVWLNLCKYGSPTDDLTVEIWSDSSGSPGSIVNPTAGVSAAVDASTLLPYLFAQGAEYYKQWVKFTFGSAMSLTNGATYWAVLKTDGSQSDVNYVAWGADASAPGYTGGVMKSYVSPTWSAESKDAIFAVQVPFGLTRPTTTLVDLTEADIVSIEHATPSRGERYNWQWSSAVKNRADASEAFFCVSPGPVPGAGPLRVNSDEFLSECQEDLNIRAGNRYAVRLNPADSTFTVNLAHGNDAALDPAVMPWIGLTISEAYARARGLTITAERFLLMEATIDVDAETGAKTQTVILERESEGTPALSYSPP
jgi:hypothetical protein